MVIVTPVLGRHEVVGHQSIVHVDAPVLDLHAVAFLGDDALDERLVGVPRVIQHDDVAGAGAPMTYANLLTMRRSWFSSVGAMLCPSTRATCTPNVTINVAYTAAETSVRHQAKKLVAHGDHSAPERRRRGIRPTRRSRGMAPPARRRLWGTGSNRIDALRRVAECRSVVSGGSPLRASDTPAAVSSASG